MILHSDLSHRSVWNRSLVIAGGLHAVAIGALFVHLVPSVDQSPEVAAIAVEMAPPAAQPAPTHDASTPRQVEAPQPVPQKQPTPRKLPFDPPPAQAVATKPEVVLQPRKEDPPPTEKADPLPPAPTTTQMSAPDLKPDKKTTALLNDGASAGKASAADQWKSRVRARIELMKRYPADAERQGQQGEVEVLVTINRAGQLLDARVRSSQGFALLNDAALEAVRRASPFPKPPKEIEGETIRKAVTLRFFKKGR